LTDRAAIAGDLPIHRVMTTWHDELKEALWWFLFAAYDQAVSPDRVAVLDLTYRIALPQMNSYLDTLAAKRTA
jgi:hypothetical protein